MVEYKKRDTTKVVVIKKGARAKVKHLTDKKLRAYLQTEADRFQSLIRSPNQPELVRPWVWCRWG